MIAPYLLLYSALIVELFAVVIAAMCLIGHTQPGKELTFLRGGGSMFDLYGRDLDHGLTARLTRDTLWIQDFDWSPNGQHIVLEVVTRDTEDTIYLLDMQGNLSLMTQGYQPRWSPDGSAIAFMERGNDGYYVVTHSLDDAERQVLGKTFLANSAPTWSPDGNWMAYLLGTYTYEAFIVNLVNGDEPRHAADCAEIVWSPDSRSLVYTAYRGGNYDVYTMNIETNIEQAITATVEDERYPVWSPDGTRLAFVATYGYADFLRVLYADGVVSNIDLSALIGWRVYVGEPPVWSQDGTQLALSLILPSMPNSYGLYLLTFENDIVNIRRLTHGEQSELHPVWRP